MGLIQSIVNKTRDVLESDRRKYVLESIEDAYKQKIQKYEDLLKQCKKRREELLDLHTEEYNLKKIHSFDAENFMNQMERIGIDEMNHQTILDMLNRQYKEWFDCGESGDGQPS